MSPTTALTALGLALCALANVAHAQAPDLRSIRPDVMLLVDTSGSMEYMTTYTPGAGGSLGCATPGACPVCSAVPGVSQKNRWTTLLEALTGSWPSYTCTMQGTNTAGRTTPYFTGQYDFAYPVPYFQPPNGGQLTDGVLDAYVDRVKFGLMTFDGAGTLVPSAVPGASGLVSATVFTSASFLARSNGWEGMYSYGTNRPLQFPGCATVDMVNNGARSALAPAGGLVSVGNDAADYRAINQTIQNSLVATRSYGGTPIAAILDDARYYYTNNPDVASGGSGDPFYQCRSRYAMLITDGYPDSDYRGAPYRCDTAGYTCPYDTPENITSDLCHLDTSTGKCDGTGKLNGLFVVGLAISDPANRARLDSLARLGGTTASYLGTDRTSLLSGLSAALDVAAASVNTRTAPAFANGSGSGAATTQQQFQFNTGFRVGTTTGGAPPVVTPWSGILDRHRFVCDATLTPVAQPLDDSQGDRFHVVLNNRNLASSPRTLYTVLPTSVLDASKWLIGQPVAGATPVGLLPLTPAQANLPLVPFTKANMSLTAAYFGVGTAARRDDIIDWVHGAIGSGTPALTQRAMARLGDIYHSSPVVVRSPPQDISDESFNYFRQRDVVATRPTVVYVGTNDGILHAFAAGAWTYTTGPHAGTTLTAGQELWGFVPPAMLPKLDAASSGHQSMVDGTPVVREVFFRKTPGAAADGNSYHTTIVIGLRGASAYEALDVTDPLVPSFLWQYSDAAMGATYAQPGLGQALLRTGSGSLEERAIAVLPGGTGAIDLPRATAAGAAGCTGGGAGAAPTTMGTSGSRSNLKCWLSQGREVVVMDVATGERIAQFGSTRLNSPMTGSVSLFNGDTGSIASRGFMTDQDGVMWRLDMGNPTVSSWAIQPFHDVFFDSLPLNGQPAYNAPILSVDNQGHVIVLQGTGDIDVLDGTAANRVVSLTENLTCPTPASCSWQAKMNWEVRLQNSEQVTGPMELYNGNVYFGSFQSVVDPSNACALGVSRLWGLTYVDSQAAGGQPTPTGKPALETTVGSGTFAQFIVPPGTAPDGSPLSGHPIMGVGISQQPTCFSGSTTTDPYFGGTRYQVSGTGGGQFNLVAQFSGITGTSSVGVMTRQLPSPRSYTAISSWAGTTD